MFSWAKTPTQDWKTQLFLLPKLTSTPDERPCLEVLPSPAAHGLRFIDYLQRYTLHTRSLLVLSTTLRLKWLLYFHYIDEETKVQRDELIWPSSFTKFSPYVLPNNCCPSIGLLHPCLVRYVFNNTNKVFVWLVLFFPAVSHYPTMIPSFLQHRGCSVFSIPRDDSA